MRFQDAAPDARHVVYAAVQADPLVARAAALLAASGTAERILARAAMNGERAEPDVWRGMFPTLFGPGVDPALRERAEAVLAASLEVAARADETRNQLRGAIVEHTTELLLRRRSEAVRRERRVLFDGVRAEIHPYDVTVEREGAPEVYDCKWGARGINADVLDQLDDAKRHAASEGVRLTAALVVFDARRSCLVRMARQTVKREGLALVSLETLDRLGGPATRPAP